MKKWLAFVCLPVAGLVTAVAVAAGTPTTGEVSVCATASTPAHTLAVDASDVSTIAGDTATKCATTTYTIPTVTETTTVTTTSDPPPPPADPPPPVPVGALLFGDEFNGSAGSKPDPTQWLAPVRTAGSSGTLLDGWNQISEDGSGNLDITAYKDSADAWHSGEMYSANTYSGPRYIEARALMAPGYGTWNAPVWETHKGSATFEDDVNEQLGREPQTYHATLHNWTVSPQVGSGKTIPATSDLSADFHTYGAAVYADHVDFYLDGTLMATTNASAIGLSNLTQYAENAVVSLFMGGSWAGTPTITGPVSMLEDYIHVYQLATTAPTFASETAYTQTRPAFTPTREVDVSSASALKTALANLQAGDLVKATAPFTVTGETVINKALASTAVLDLSAGVSFVYSGGSNLPAVYVKQASHLQIYGGDLSTSDTGGSCLLIHGSQQILWWGFTVHDCGGSGVAVFTTLGAIDHLDLEGDITAVGRNLAWDPHTDKGTGVHGAILWDASTSNAFTNSRFAFDVHQITVGACVELGNPTVAAASGNTLIAQCDGNPCKATSQTCGNGLELWGDTSTLGLDVQYLAVNDYAGAAIESELTSGQNANGVTVEYGRALNNDLTNPYPTNLTLWDSHGGEVYQDVAP